MHYKDDNDALFSMRMGKAKAFNYLFKKYWKKLYYVAFQRIRNQCDCEDIIHDLFLELWKNRERIKIKSSFEAYLFTSLKYKIFRHYNQRRLADNFTTEYVLDNIFTNNEDIENYLSAKEIKKIIEQKIELLPEKCKIVFKLSRFENYNVKVIASKLNISPNTAQNHISKALKILRLGLNKNLIILISIIII